LVRVALPIGGIEVGVESNDDGRMRSSPSTPRFRHIASVAVRDPAQMETLCRTLQWLEEIEDLDEEIPALIELKRAILLQIAELEIQEEDAPNAA
jgi:hypothetical protein